MPNIISKTCRLSNHLLSKLVLIAALSVLCACSNAPVSPTMQTVNLEEPDKTPPLPNPTEIQPLPFHWVVITKDRLPTGDFVYYGMTPKDYENLSMTNADTIRWIKEAQWLLNYYRDNPQNVTGAHK